MKALDQTTFFEMFAIATERPATDYTLETKLADLECWDSIAVLNFIVAAEDKLGVIVSPDQIGESATLQELYNAVQAAN